MTLNIKKYFNQENLFVAISASLILAIFVFQNWLYWPGYIQDDSQTTLLLDKSGWHPAIMAYLLEIAYKLFGVHVYDLFLMITVPFYLGMFIIVYSVYKKTNSWLSILLIFPIFIGNVYYSIIKMSSISFLISWSYLLYAMTLYMVLRFEKKKISKTFYVFYGIVFIIALLSRHTAILHIWPVTFIWIAMFLSAKEYSFWGYIKRFVPLIILSALFCLTVSIGLNFMLAKSDKGHVYPESHIILHQIIGTCAPEMDESCFNPDWWYGKWATDPDRMKHLKEKYKRFREDSEVFSFSNTDDPAFKFFTNLEGRYSKWFYAIRKYPKNYFEHIHFFYIDYWQFHPSFLPSDAYTWKYTKETMLYQVMVFHPISERELKYFESIIDQIPVSERSLQWTDKKAKIEEYMRKNPFSYNMSVFVKTCFVLFLIGFMLFLIKRKNLLNVFLFSISTAGVLNWIFVPPFCPRLFIRYVDPAIVLTVLSLEIFLIILCSSVPEVYAYIKNKIKYISKKKRYKN